MNLQTLYVVCLCIYMYYSVLQWAITNMFIIIKRKIDSVDKMCIHADFQKRGSNTEPKIIRNKAMIYNE